MRDISVPMLGYGLTIKERGDRVEAVLAALDVDFERVGPATFQYGPDGIGVGTEEAELVSAVLHLIDARYPPMNQAE